MRSCALHVDRPENSTRSARSRWEAPFLPRPLALRFVRGGNPSWQATGSRARSFAGPAACSLVRRLASGLSPPSSDRTDCERRLGVVCSVRCVRTTTRVLRPHRQCRCGHPTEHHFDRWSCSRESRTRRELQPTALAGSQSSEPRGNGAYRLTRAVSQAHEEDRPREGSPSSNGGLTVQAPDSLAVANTTNDRSDCATLREGGARQPHRS